MGCRTIAGIVVALMAGSSAFAQVPSAVLEHRPLPLEEGRSYETARAAVPVLEETVLAGRVRLAFANRPDHRAAGPSDDPDYADYGKYTARMSLDGNDLSRFDRISFDVKTACDDDRVVNLNMGYGAVSHFVHLKNDTTLTCFLDLTDPGREAAKDLFFTVTNRGPYRDTRDSSRFEVTNVRLQRLADPAVDRGWRPRGIVLSTAGYATGAAKTAVVPFSTGRFALVDAETGRVRYRGSVRPEGSTLGDFGVIDFTPFDREGTWRIEAEGLVSTPFPIAAAPWTEAEWKALNFIFCQRCGYAVPGIHDACHRDLFCVHDGRYVSYGGGWHDAGDLSQQTLQTGDVAFSLLEAAVSTSDPLLSARLEEEARWGFSFLLRCRFGDGFRASSMGLLHWLDGEVGTMDDIVSVRKQDLAFDNYLYAGYEAYAALHLRDRDGLADDLARAAEEDFAFAEAGFRERGFEPFRFVMEHSYNTSPSQYMATVAWSAAQLFLLTGKTAYRDTAVEAIRYTLDCQRTDPVGSGIRGFFYRDRSRRSIVHYIHQSREQVYMQALTLLCTAFPGHPDRARWEEGIRLYGGYLKDLMRFTAPYGMIPSGVYHRLEYEDAEAFGHLHIQAPADAAAHYRRQFGQGVALDADHAVKRFPIWFTIFNGNNAVLLSQGKAAALCGRYLQDPELLRIGREQLYWLAGKNPFGQSMIYGVGWNYPSMNSFSCGEMTGEMPVGIRTQGDTDEPLWPRVNNACYKEVWVTVAGKFLSLVSEYQ